MAERCILLLLTGSPGVGKSTLIKRVFERFKSSNPNLNIKGFYTREVRDGSERVGFEVVTLDGRTSTLASSTVSTLLRSCQVREDTDLVIIDEVGKMELFSSLFFPAVLNILESNIPVLATVPIQKFGRDLPAVARLKNHPGAQIFTLSPSNRDDAREHIYSQLLDLVSKR